MLVCLGTALGCRPRRDGAEAIDAGIVPSDAPAAAEDAGGAHPVHIVQPPAPGSFVQLTRDLGDAVVNIRTKGVVTGGPASLYPNARPDSSLGTGFVVDREFGYVLTALHIVAPAKGLRVVFASGLERDAEIVGRAPHLDIALVQIGGLPEDYPVLTMGESDNLSVGEWVLALGNPFGGEVTASAGIISSLGGSTSIYEPPQERYRSLLHTDAAIHRGNSGGPLVNLAGEVIGINSAMGRGSFGIGFAVPSSQVNRVFDKLRQGKVAEVWLGILVQPVTEANAGTCAPTGVFVSQVYRHSPAAKAGLEAGDIIVKFGEHDVDEPKLTALARGSVPGQRIELRLCRKGSEIKRLLVTEAKPN